MTNRVAILQYADDTIIFLKHDFAGALHMKLLLYLFEMLAGLKINFNKSEIRSMMKEIGGKLMLICLIVNLACSPLST